MLFFGGLCLLSMDIAWARKVLIPPLKEQVCNASLIIAGEIVEVTPDASAVSNDAGPRKYTDFFTAARINVLQILKGDLNGSAPLVMYFHTRSENSPYDYGDKRYLPVKGANEIWFIVSRKSENGSYEPGNFLGTPIDIRKTSEISKLAKECGK